MKDIRDREFNSLKILHHFNRLLALAQGRSILPVTIELDPVAYCNHACGWCVDPVHDKTQLEWSTFERLIDELIGLRHPEGGIEGLVFKGGGEPSLHPRFADMVAYTARAGLTIGVVSNGSRLHGVTETLAKHAAYVRISVDGPTAESHWLIHRSRDFDVVIDGVKDLVAARSGCRYPLLGLSFAMDMRTVDLAQQAVDLGESLGVDYVLLRPPFFEEVGRAPSMNAEQAKEVRRRLRQVARVYRGNMEVLVGDWVGDSEQEGETSSSLSAAGRRDRAANAHRPIEHRTGRCLASPLMGVITARGDVYGCCNLRALAPWSFGRLDYPNGVDFASIWFGSAAARVLQSMRSAECIRHCTHPLSRYNEIIELLNDRDRPHSQFV